MKIRNQLIKTSEKEDLKTLFNDYLSELNESLDYPYLDLYWTEDARFPYWLIMNDQKNRIFVSQ
jgi:hypothetical protein